MTIMIETKKLLSLIDLTSLNATDSHTSINLLIEKANKSYKGAYPASVCTYLKYGHLLKKRLESKIKSCVVSTYFPSSQSPLELKLQEIEYLESMKIDEIDIVLSIGEFLDGNDDYVLKELSAIRKASSKTLKLIIESGTLEEHDLIEKATRFGLETGMNFIKTSTGTSLTGATPEAVKVIAETIRRFFSRSEITCGLKIAGGIKSREEATKYIELTQDILGPSFVNPNTFRFGASSLYGNLISEK